MSSDLFGITLVTDIDIYVVGHGLWVWDGMARVIRLTEFERLLISP